MKRQDFELEPALAAFLRPRGVREHAPPEVRRRALAAARALAGGEAVITPAASGLPPSSLRAGPSAGLGRLAWAAAATVVVAGVGAFAALHVRAINDAPANPAGQLAALPSARTPDRPIPPEPTNDEQTNQEQTKQERRHDEESGRHERAPARPVPPSAAHLGRPAQTRGVDEGLMAELALLRRARLAYNDGEFSGALSLIAEHAQKFPRGRLAEQREALRVRSLTAAGRTAEARRAAAAFAAQFPRSVLLGPLAQRPEDAE